MAGLVETFKGIYETRDGQRVPAGRARAAVTRRARRCSSPGTTRARRSTVGRTTSRTTSARPSTSSRWSSATRATSPGTGVAFTRDPSTGEPGLYGEFLADAQGEDVVAGIRTPEPLARDEGGSTGGVRAADVRPMRRLEEHYRDVQDIEFTVEDGRLYLLQTRSAKRTAAAALKSAVDMVDEGLISREDAVVAHRPRTARPAPAPDDRSRRRASRSSRRG